MNLPGRRRPWLGLVVAAALTSGLTLAYAQQAPAPRGATSFMPVDLKEPFAEVMARMKAAQPAIQQRQADLLAERYDLADRPASGVTMSKGKPVQEGVRVKLATGTSWEQLAGLSPTEIRDRTLFPKGFLPLPHRDRRDQAAGGARSHALRPGIRHSRPVPARVPRTDLPDHAARPRRRLAGQAGHHR